MKYNENNQPIVCLQTQSACYKSSRTQEILGIMWHSNETIEPYLKRYVQPSDNAADRDVLLKILGKNTANNDYNHKAVEKGMNAYIGKTANGNVISVQTLPWNYRPWGCGKGVKGSCNDGWIQIEICESAITDEEYFNTVYQEAIELTAYLVQKYNLNPIATAKHKNGIMCPVITCHREAAKLGLASDHIDVLHLLLKYGKSMQTVRDDVQALLGETTDFTEIFRVRSDWSDPKTQAGAYTSLEKAIAVCKKLNSDYKVFNSNGEIAYEITKEDTLVEEKPLLTPEEIEAWKPKKGEKIKLRPHASWSNGLSVPKWVYMNTLYFRGVRDKYYIISTTKIGSITGVIAPEFVLPYEVEVENNFEEYVVFADPATRIRKGPGTNYAQVGTIGNSTYNTIVEESLGKGASKWGRLKNNKGWISLDLTKKI